MEKGKIKHDYLMAYVKKQIWKQNRITCNKQFPECPEIPSIKEKECKKCPYKKKIKKEYGDKRK